MNGTILIVDDNESARDLMEGLLFPLGYTLHFAVTGPEALAMLDDVRPDMVLLDVMMPGMDGFEVCRRIRAHPHWQTLPVILVTALNDRSARIRGLEAGADDFLSKPVDAAEIQARVRSTVELGRVRRQLQERARFEWVVMHSQEGFVWLDADGILQGANPVARRWLSLDTLASFSERPWLEVIAESFTVMPPHTWDAIQAAGEAFEMTFVRPETANVTGFWLYVQGSPLPPVDNQGDAWMVRLEDVTALQSSTQQIVTTIYLIAHKLRTPLTLVRGPLELLEANEIDLSSPEGATFFQVVMDNLNLLQDEIGQILHIVQQWDRPLLHTQLKPFDGAQIVAMVDHLRQGLRLPSEQCVLEVDVARSWRLHPNVLELLLYNLMANAVKFHPLHLPHIHITIEEDESHALVLCVEDDGPGIPPEHREQVWRPLYQIDREATGQVPGFGLGLTLVANYAWAYNGRFWIEESRLGGARVCVVLPARDDF